VTRVPASKRTVVLFDGLARGRLRTHWGTVLVAAHIMDPT